MAKPLASAGPLVPGEAGDLEYDVRLAELIRAAVLETPGVAGMGRGRLAEAATYWVNRKVLGVVIRPDAIEVHVVARYPEAFPLPKFERRLRARLQPLAQARRTDLVIEDLAMPDETD